MECCFGCKFPEISQSAEKLKYQEPVKQRGGATE